MRLMRTTVAQAHPRTQVPGACTMAPVWTWWAASAVPAPQATLACAARPISTSVARAPATRLTPGTACRTQGGASAAFAEPASQVRVGQGAGLGSGLCSPTVADPRAPGCPGPRCQTVLSPCESQPCQHGGQCRPGPGSGGALSFTCHCVSVSGGGWSHQGLCGLVGGRAFRGEEAPGKRGSGKC